MKARERGQGSSGRVHFKRQESPRATWEGGSIINQLAKKGDQSHALFGVDGDFLARFMLELLCRRETEVCTTKKYLVVVKRYAIEAIMILSDFN